MVNAQKWLDKRYPKRVIIKKEREKITWLDIRNENLEGDLDLSDFISLKELNCSNNELTFLNLNKCFYLTKLWCSNNLLTNLVLPNDPINLKTLYLGNNNFTSIQNLSFLVPVTNLEELRLGNYDYSCYDDDSESERVKQRISQGIYNKFTGSLDYLSNMKKLKELNVSNIDVNEVDLDKLPDSLEKIFYSTKERPISKVKEIYFPLKLSIKWKYWRSLDFIKEEAIQWIQTGIGTTEDYNFIAWLRDIQKLDLKWALDNEEEFKELRDKYKYFGTCKECSQPNVGRNWCQPCNAKHWQQHKWTSGNSAIDKFIHKYQLEATDSWNILEWIPYEQFTNAEFLAKGGFGEVYKAQWTNGPIREWNNENNQWKRGGNKEVALKSLNNSQNVSAEFLREIASHKLFKDELSGIVPCYGISRDSKGNYVMVMEYMKEGNLRQYLQKNYRELSFNNKVEQLHAIIKGLKDIHRQNLVHKDFHSGNILYPPCRITDLGLSKPVGEEKRGEKVFGVVPYVAPEVLQEKPYTKAADIYSFGMISYEVLTGLTPYHGSAHDIGLILSICKGKRPKFQIKIPLLLEDLIKKCWDDNPLNRPKADEISKIFDKWHKEIKDEKSEFTQQVQEAEKSNQKLLEEVRFPSNKLHAGAFLTSKPINTGQISKLLFASKDIDLDLEMIEEFDIKDNEQDEQDEQIAQQAIPPK